MRIVLVFLMWLTPVAVVVAVGYLATIARQTRNRLIDVERRVAELEQAGEPSTR
ncbi:MAG: hypothetical protein GY925_08190 [Actinomycetia bacterium]|nr:hypothetical protein [Actinomycetes bacterium]